MYNHVAIRAARESAQVERCHTIPHIGSYTVGQHCYGALALLLLLHENPSIGLIKAVAFHDLPERWLGDVPGPGKNGAIADAFADAESAIFTKLGMLFHLTDEDRFWLKLVDILDLWLWSLEQETLGSRTCAEIEERCCRWLCKNAPVGDVSEFVRRTQTERQHRGGERLSSVFAEVPTC